MRLPFGTDQFFAVFARYNEAVWPAQWLLYILALVAIIAALRRGAGGKRSRVIAGVLAFLWLWMGVVYHLIFFRPINPAAAIFGLAFIIQAGLLLWLGVRQRALRFGDRRGWRGMAGIALVTYALVLYPWLGAALGHTYPAAPTFGLPCPTTIFTLGLLLWAAEPPPWAVLVVPLAWAAIGTSAAMELGVPEDFGLAVAALLVLVHKVGGDLMSRATRAPLGTTLAD